MLDWTLFELTRKHSPPETALYTQEHYRFWELTGPDAETFLQGQVTNDISALNTREVCLTAHCNAKGRVVSLFHVAKVGETRFLLKIRKELADIAIQHLKKYMVFSKAELSEFNALSIASPSAAQAHELEQNAQASQRYPDGTHEYWLNANDMAEFVKNTKTVFAPERSWGARLIAFGIPEINNQQSEAYLPQELNLDLVNAVNFKKGCYTGQEIIARLHYRGKSKKRLLRGSIDSALSELAAIENDQGKKLGEIVSLHTYDDKTDFLALVSLESQAHDCFAVHANGRVKIQWGELPYAIPEE